MLDLPRGSLETSIQKKIGVFFLANIACGNNQCERASVSANSDRNIVNSATQDIHELIERHEKWLRRVVRARTVHTDMVDDVMSEVLLAVSKSPQRPPPEEWQPWLCKIAVRQAALANRTALRREQLSERYAKQNVGDEFSEDPIVWLLDKERHDTLRMVLGDLDLDMRELLIAKYVHRQTYAQIGERLGIAEHVAEYRVSRAKKQLRSMLVERGLSEEDVK